jgi:hypothetical protein
MDIELEDDNDILPCRKFDFTLVIDRLKTDVMPILKKDDCEILDDCIRILKDKNTLFEYSLDDKRQGKYNFSSFTKGIEYSPKKKCYYSIHFDENLIVRRFVFSIHHNLKTHIYISTYFDDNIFKSFVYDKMPSSFHHIFTFDLATKKTKHDCTKL